MKSTFLILPIFSLMLMSCVGADKTAANDNLVLNSFDVNPVPLYVVDGVVVSSIDSLSPSSIAEMYVLKEQKAIDKYGHKGEHGVIEIITKKTAPSQ